MQYYERPKTLVFQGEEAVEILTKYAKALEENKPEELTGAQAKAMIKLTRSLISTIQSEKTVKKDNRTPPLIPKLRKAVKQWVTSRSCKPSPMTTCQDRMRLRCLPPPIDQQPK